jgi:hypothetical protein
MRKFVPVRIMELARRKEVAAAAVLLLTGGLIWLAASDSEPAVRENSLDGMRFGELGAETGAAGHAAAAPGAAQTTHRIPPAYGADTATTTQPAMSAWVLSNGALDLNGEFVPPPIQVASRRNPPAEELNPPRQSARPAHEQVIQQLQMEVDASVPTARLTGVSLDGEAAGR